MRPDAVVERPEASPAAPSPAPANRSELLVISPVFNEAAHLERTARALAAQRRRPDRWVVVDDASTDGTLDLAHRLAAELPFMEVLAAPPRPAGPEIADRLATAREAVAFNAGLRHAGWRAFAFVGKLDGDVELPPEWFERLLEAFMADPALGVAGGRLAERDARGWRRLSIPDHHVHGAVKLFRRECLEQVGGVVERLGWDTIDETRARMLGWRSRSFADVIGRHHRPWGSADGRLRGRARHGECAWVLRYGLVWVLGRSIKVAATPPVGLSGAAFVWGYLRAALRGAPHVDDPEFARFARAELRRRVRSRLLSAVAGRKLLSRAAR